jgi:hypothetical protein
MRCIFICLAAELVLYDGVIIVLNRQVLNCGNLRMSLGGSSVYTFNKFAKQMCLGRLYYHMVLGNNDMYVPQLAATCRSHMTDIKM